MKALLLLIVLIHTNALPDATAILDNINIARTTPSAFATIIQTKYSDILGAADAVAYLNTAPTLNAVLLKTALSAGAQLHANYLKTQPYIMNPHVGCNENLLKDRVNDLGTYTKIGENVISGISNEEEIVARWLIDSEYSSKINRRNILYNDFKYVGIGSSNTVFMNNLVVVYFADGFTCNPCANIPAKDVGYDCSPNPYTYGMQSASKIFFSMILLLIVMLTLF
jgi:uncharacterized protein YkwD